MSKKQQKDVLTDNNEKGNLQMKNNKKQDDFLFYPENASITEDVAIQKIIMSANNIIDIAENISENFKIIIGYRALNKLLFSEPSSITKNSDKVENEFEWVHGKSIENMAYCLEHESPFTANPEMYVNFDTSEYAIKNIEFLNTYKPIFAICIAQTTDPKDFLSIFKGKFNLIDLIIKDTSFAEDLIRKNLINFYFKFDVKYAKNQEISDKSTMKVVFQLVDEGFLKTYSWSFNMKSFLAGQSEPTLTTSLAMIGVLVEDSCI